MDRTSTHRLIHQMAFFEQLTHLCSATEYSLSATLPHHPLPSPLAVLHRPHPPLPTARKPPLKALISHHDAETFASVSGGVVAGFVLYYPNYSSFLAKPGMMYIEDMYVREAYERRGLGKMLLSAVAVRAAKMGFGMVERCVLVWNVNAIEFYEEMVAEVLQQ